MERRGSPRRRSLYTQPELTVLAGSEKFSAKLIDSSDGGLGITIQRPLDVGCRVRIQGKLAIGVSLRPVDAEGTVRWCRADPQGMFHCGILLETAGTARASNPSDQDYYEVLQLSPNADTDTIHRVFRLLAQRFHPDNRETGDEVWFKVLSHAHETLSDPERRAAYDARRTSDQKTRWKIFDSTETARGVEAERRKRQGILSLLYMRRMTEPREPGMSLQELEQLLGCPKEHLEFAVWFLRENAWIERADNGRVSITAKGAEKAEESGALPVGAPAGEDRMLVAPAK